MVYAETVLTLGAAQPRSEVRLHWSLGGTTADTICVWEKGRCLGFGQHSTDPETDSYIRQFGKTIQIFSFDVQKMKESVEIRPDYRLSRDGSNLAGYLDFIRDNGKERFDALVSDLHRWIPEFDDIGFEVPSSGHKSFRLRTTQGKHAIRAADLSDGTIYAVALLAIAHQPEAPSIVGLEEPDHGLHPRLLREVRDALYRLSYPDQFGEKRKPVQVIATTHSPYFLDLFKDHPEEVTVAEKQSDGSVIFESLKDDAHLSEIIGDASLGDVWYTGVLGGVPR